MSVNLSVVHHCLMASLTVVSSCMSCQQRDVQSFADGNLQHKLDLSNGCVNWRVNAR